MCAAILPTSSEWPAPASSHGVVQDGRRDETGYPMRVAGKERGLRMGLAIAHRPTSGVPKRRISRFQSDVAIRVVRNLPPGLLAVPVGPKDRNPRSQNPLGHAPGRIFLFPSNAGRGPEVGVIML